MGFSFTVLASGSSGNAALLRGPSFGLLIDFGLRHQYIAERLGAVGASWKEITAVLLSHTHGDHVNRHTLGHLRALKIPLFHHTRHSTQLQRWDEYEILRKAGQIQLFEKPNRFPIAAGLDCLPVQVPHDSEPTFAFRLEGRHANGQPWAVGYASDLGSIPSRLVEPFTGLDLLALEFNYDHEMQECSPRPRFLINRVLGNYGHLSNEQAGHFVRKLTGRPENRLQTLVMLHLSRQCNTPELAMAAAQSAFTGRPQPTIISARQHEPTPVIPILEPHQSAPTPGPIAAKIHQPCLPGM